MKVTLNSSPVISTWLWNTDLIETEIDDTLAYLTGKNVTVLYLQFDNDVSNSSYQQFIKRAAEKNINVFALEGSASWVENENSKEKGAFINWLTTYQQEAAENEKFAGIHLDVEPYLSTVWEEDYEKAVLRYQTILSDVHKEAEKLGIRFEADIPFWFDERRYENNTYGSGILSEWIIDLTDSVTVMAYRNKLDGNNGILKLTNKEIDYADNQEKEIMIAIETKPLEEKHLSFAGNRTGLHKAIQQIQKSYKQHESFRGIGVHDYKYWKALDNH